MRKFYFFTLLFGTGCTVERPIKISITIIDSGTTDGGDFDDQDDDFNNQPEPTNEPGNDPTGGDPTGGDPTGGDSSGNETGGDPTGGDPTGGDPTGGNTGGGPGGGGVQGSFDACDAYIYCVLAGEDASLTNLYFNEHSACTDASFDQQYETWFSCVVSNKGEPCSGANNGSWEGCDCQAVVECTEAETDPFE